MERLNRLSKSIVITGSQDVFEQFEASMKRHLTVMAVDSFKVFFDAQGNIANSIISVLTAEHRNEADIIIVEKLAEISDKEVLISKAVEIKKACEKAGNLAFHIYGYFLLPGSRNDAVEEEMCSNTYAALQRMEYHMALEEQAYDDVILVSGDGQEIQEWLANAITDLSESRDVPFLHRTLYRDWRKTKEEYLSSDSILSGGLVKSTVLPEDSHSYCCMGYACTELTGGGTGSGIVGNMSRQLFSGTNGGEWIMPGRDRIDGTLQERKVRELLGIWPDDDISGFWEKYLLEPLSVCSTVEGNSVGLTRAQINSRNIKEYVQGFHIEEKVTAGIDTMTEKLKKIPEGIVTNAYSILESYGPGVIQYLFYGNREGTDVSVRKILYLGFEQLEKAAKEKTKRPVRQIVGSLAEDVLEVRIIEWKKQFQFAVESEIRSKVALYFTSEEGEWKNLVVKPLEKFAEACSKMAEELYHAAAGHHPEQETSDLQSKPIKEKEYRVNLADCAPISEWLAEQTPDHLQPAQLSVLKKQLANYLMQQAKEGKKADKTVSEMLVNTVTGKKVTLTDYFLSYADTHEEGDTQDMIRQFVKECLAQLLKKSTPELETGAEERHRRQWVIFPEKLLESKYGEVFRTVTAAYLRNYGSGECSVVGSGSEHISCYQSGIALPLYEIEGLWKWEQAYNKKMETETMDWRHYFPLALRHLNRNGMNKKFYEDFFKPCVDYALREKIIERKSFPGEERKYLYVMNLLPDSWINFDVSNYNVGTAGGRAQKGEALFHYLHSMNAFSTDDWQQDIILPGSGVFSEAYDFSQATDGLDIESISISYMKRILQKNIPLFVLLRGTVQKYRRIQKDIDELRIAPSQAAEEISEGVRRQDSAGESPEEAKEVRQKFTDILNQVEAEKAESESEEPAQTDAGLKKFCKFCGRKLKTGKENFCPGCGKSLRT